MIVYYSEYSMFVVGDDVPKWLPKWASKLKTIMSDMRLRNGNFPFQNRKGCELGLYIIMANQFPQFYIILVSLTCRAKKKKCVSDFMGLQNRVGRSGIFFVCNIFVLSFE